MDTTGRASHRRRTPREPDFSLSPDDLREVARFNLSAAEEVLALYESAAGADDRPRLAIGAARAFVQGAARSKLQLIAGPGAHRAAKEAPTQAAYHAAMAAGEAAISAYLHPLADAAQVNHILRAVAHAARAIELSRPEDPHAAQDSLERATRAAKPMIVAILRRYPLTSQSANRLAALVHELDLALRDGAVGIEIRQSADE